MDRIIHFKDNVFLGALAHESVPLVGFLPATRWILVVCHELKNTEKAQVERRSVSHDRIWAPLEPSWEQLGPTWGEHFAIF